MSTENGISKFIPGEERFENYADERISFRVRFSEAASLYTSWGRPHVWNERRHFPFQSGLHPEKRLRPADCLL